MKIGTKIARLAQTEGLGAQSGREGRRWGQVALAYGLAVVWVALASLARWWLLRTFGPMPTFVTYYPAVLLSAIIGGGGAGILATILSALAADYWFIPPLGFGVEAPNDIVALGIFSCFNLFLCVAMERLRRAQRVKAAYERELAVRESEERFRLLFEQAAVGIKRVDFQEHMLEVNDKQCDILGYSREELLKLSLKDFTHPEDLSKERVELDRLKAREISDFSLEKRCLRKDGRVIWVRVTASLPVGGDGSPHWWISVVEDITQRKEAEEEIKRNERRLESLLKISQLRTDSTQKLLDYALEEAIVLTGSKIGYIYRYDETKKEFTLNTWSKDVMKQCTIAEQQTKYQLEKTGIWGEAVRQAKPIVINDFHAPDPLKKGYPEGHSPLHKFMTVPVFSDGHIVGVVGVANKEADYDDTDVRQLTLLMDVVWKITERKKAEEDLRYQLQLNQSITDKAAASIFVTDEQGRVTFMNPEAEKVFGFTRDELLGQSLHDTIHHHYPDGRPFPASECRTASLYESGETVRDYEQVFFRKDGSQVIVSCSNATLELNGKRTGALLIAQDITERKRAEEALRESESRLRTILDALPVAIFLSDRQGNVIFTNPAVQRIWGISTHVSREGYGEYKGRWLESGEPVRPEQWALPRVLDTGEPFINDLVELDDREGGRKTIYNFALPIRGDSGQLIGAVVVTEDVTERMRAQEQLRLAKEAAERTAEELARSNKDLEQFAYVSSHDLQEPLRMVGGFMQLFSQKYQGQLDPVGDRYIRFAVDGAKRMQQLIDDLLAYSRVGTKAREPELTDTGDLLRQALANLSVSIAESGAQITSGEMPLARVDGPQVVQVFQNLVSNAIKFRGDGPPKIHVDARRDGGCWEFSVKDCGIGINPEYNDKIFMIFQRLHTKEKYPGTGIGLAICKKIVDRHGGRIWVESAEGHGSTFRFTLPI